MIPLRDTQPSNCFPVVTYSLIATNLVVFIIQLMVGLNNEQFIYHYGLVPAKYTIHQYREFFSLSNKLFSMVSYMFLHGGFLHFIGNMWSLYIFGDNVEDHLGSVRFLVFYMACGLISGLMHFTFQPFSDIPTIGASGAIAGVMGAYFLLYPRSKILTLIPIIFIPFFFEIPAFIFLGIWFLIQFFNAAAGGAGGGIAWWAHIGGFVAGLVLIKLNGQLPQAGTREKIQQYTAKKRSPKLQTIATRGNWKDPKDPDLYGEIRITPYEAVNGVLKMVTIPWGFYKPVYKVNVPPGVKEGTKLRLARMGKQLPSGIKGDMFLTVTIKQ